MVYYFDLFFFSLLNKLSSISKPEKNSFIFIVSNICLFRANYIIDKNTF